MPLTEEQKGRLREALGPMVKEALQEGVTPMVQAEVNKILAEAKDADRSYSSKIFSAREQERVRQIESDPTTTGFGVARLARCIALANNDREKAIHYAKTLYQDSLGDAVVKVLQSGDDEAGGVFVPSELASTFIDALRAKAVVRQAGPVTIDLTSGNLRIPKVTTDPTAGWVGEGSARNASNMKTGDINFTAKTLQGKSSVTTELLRRSGQNAEQVIRNGLVRVMANEEDKGFLAGSGTEHSPKGMLNWAVAANKFNANATVNLTNVQTDLRTAMSNLTDNDVDIDMAVWFMSHRSRNHLAFQLRDTEDAPVFKGELTAPNPTLNGQRAFITNNIPNNLGVGNDESRVYFAAMDQAWLAEEQGLRVRASTEASFTDESGNLVSAFDKGLMVIIIERDVDFAMGHGEAVSVIEAVTWGS
ncbi:MAG: phage major capsid protein [Nitrosopumilaceae archaeon]|nr:phage major capsid protein [Nitrosopumilaceae archaeon]NIU87796.1 phage major capsid protein [Nitrosopumilaceae archaeon]NIV65179.1 phage major capsid protein [Nitrosopumilaceae archaeon]NIX61694.1 phage major capsid protein [Nitrosopumilaceae archaeon]